MAAPPIRKACDACHKRKVRCSGEQPCNNCAQTSLQCTYLAIPQKKGPKGSRGKIISGIRNVQKETIPDETSASSAPSMTREPSFDFNSPPISPPNAQNVLLLSRQTIENCMDFYFNNMSTTAWILDRGVLKNTISSRLGIDPEIYCLTGSLCAFVMVQPGMNLAVAPGSHYEGEPPEGRYGYANMLLDDILRVRKSIEYVESPTLAAVQTSFFLFSCYFHPGKTECMLVSLARSCDLGASDGHAPRANLCRGRAESRVCTGEGCTGYSLLRRGHMLWSDTAP